MMARFVLVHGAMGNASVWPPSFIAGLEAKGHTVEAFDLPAQGADPTPKEDVTLQMYADRTVQQLRSRPEPAVLVGHSMGGMVVTQAADDFVAAGGELAQVVYLTAFLPRNGQSLLDLAGSPENAGDQVQANLTVSGEPPIGVFDVEAAPQALFNTTSAEVLATLPATYMESQPIIPFTNPVTITDDRPLTRRFIFALQDLAIRPAMQRKMAAATAVVETVEIDADHMVFSSAPTELIEVLDRFARS
jgi:pimeloyl-ACP methyl ester carboxylesterase